MSKKYDFGDLSPVVEKSELQKKIDEALSKHLPMKNTVASPAFVPRTAEDREIAKELNIIEKGQKCESDIRYALSYLDRKKFKVFANVFVHGINAEGEPEDQEHDVIVVCNDMVFDIEAKSVSGDMLTICPDGQWEVKAGYKNYAVPNPLAQVERHKYNLEYRLAKLGTPVIEIVATNNTRLLIKDEYAHLPYILLKSDMLAAYIAKTAKNTADLGSAAALVYQCVLGGRRAPPKHK
jgi:hypothetical protein